jgi:hypothetical protein
MSSLSETCPKCQGKMIQGFLADFAHGFIGVSTWVEGPPKKTYWGGSTDTTFRQRLPVATFRCEACGFLESYAGEDFAAE